MTRPGAVLGRAPTQYRRNTDVIPTLVFGLVAGLAGPALALDVPSGQPVELVEVLVEQQADGDWVRFRFIAPHIAREGGTITYAEAEPDFAHLCESFAVPYIAQYELTADVVVISLADRAVEFGQADPEATQFFEAFRLEDGACIWEEF